MKTGYRLLSPLTLTLCVALTLCTFSGCGGSDSPGNDPSTNTTAPTTEKLNGKADITGGAEQKVVSKHGLWTHPNGKQMFGKVPLDVFYSNPLAVAATQGQVVQQPTLPQPGQPTNPGTNPSKTPGGMASAPPPSTNPGTSTPAASGGGADWSKIIPLEVVQDEVKNMTNSAKTDLASLRAYKSEYKNVAMKAATIAAIAGIATEHPADIRWKDKAKHLRDAAAAMTLAAEKPDKANMEQATLEMEKIEEMLRGSVPAGVDESTAAIKPYNDVAERDALMRRMEKSFNYLKIEVNNEDKLKGNAETVKHEAAVLAALSKVIAHSSYTSADEKEYADEAKGMINDSQVMIDSVASENFASYSDAIGKIQKRCAQCHSEYRFSDDF